jgi:sortase A
VSTLLHDRPPAGARPSRHRGDRVRTIVSALGELLITLGMVVLLFVVYELYWTNLVSADKQSGATSALDQQWSTGQDPTIATTGDGQTRTGQGSVPLGQGFAKLYVPSFGSDYQFTVVEGTTQDDLAIGPGHYVGTALPGQPGDFAVAGHRVGQGAPFNDLDLLQSCDSIITETADTWSVYRVLPMSQEVAGWSTGKGASDPRCAGTTGADVAVGPLGGAYSGVVGREIVDPSQGNVIAPVPGNAAITPTGADEASLLTLTTCTPRYTANQRLIIHAVLVKKYPKSGSAPGVKPPEMTAG